jgi:hypothetical protein
VGSWSKGALVWEFIIEETRVDILDFYLWKHKMIFVHKQERRRESSNPFLQFRVVKDYNKQCVLIGRIVC